MISDVDLIALGPKAFTRYRQTGRHPSGPSARPAQRVPAAEDAIDRCAGKPASLNHQLRRPAGAKLAEVESCAQGTSLGGVDRCRWRWARRDWQWRWPRARLVDDSADGVWLIELAPVGDPAAVPEALAAALGITYSRG
mgnify:CR=1 FL=1